MDTQHNSKSKSQVSISSVRLMFCASIIHTVHLCIDMDRARYFASDRYVYVRSLQWIQMNGSSQNHDLC